MGFGEYDLVCLGRIAVDFYGEQHLCTLEQTTRFRRSLGGSSANVAVAAARQGLRVAMISRIGNDAMGRFLRGSLVREGVSDLAVSVDPVRRTALAFLGLQGAEAATLDFYRHDAADMAVEYVSVPEELYKRAKTLSIAGVHIACMDAESQPLRIVDAFQKAGAQLILDIDLRASLWSAAPGGYGAAVNRLRELAPRVGMIVGNEEEFCALGRGEDLCTSLRSVREITKAQLVVKLGAAGAALLPGEIPEELSSVTVPAPTIQLVNPVGAGDAFLGGLIAGLAKGLSPTEAMRRATTSGAIVAARPGCSEAMPFAEEVDLVLAGSTPASRSVERVARKRHNSKYPESIFFLACDHRRPFIDLMRVYNRDASDVAHFKHTVSSAAERVAAIVGPEAQALLMDATFGSLPIERLGLLNWTIARPLEASGSRPLETEYGDQLPYQMLKWNPSHIAKCLVFYHSQDTAELKQKQLKKLQEIQEACINSGAKWILEVITPENVPFSEEDQTNSVKDIYQNGIEPDWWKLVPQRTDQGWHSLSSVISQNDASCKGVILLGQNTPFEQIAQQIEAASAHKVVVGFAVGRAIWGSTAELWFAGRQNDRDAAEAIEQRFAALIRAFKRGQSRRLATPSTSQGQDGSAVAKDADLVQFGVTS